MKIEQAMTEDVALVSPDQTLREAAKLMAECDCGALPVGEGDRLVGMITDRDIAVRAIATGLGPDTPVRRIMSRNVCYCFADDELDDVAENMADIKVRRLPVLNRDKRLVGIIALSDIAKADGDAGVVEALCEISAPGGEHASISM